MTSIPVEVEQIFQIYNNLHIEPFNYTIKSDLILAQPKWAVQ